MQARAMREYVLKRDVGKCIKGAAVCCNSVKVARIRYWTRRRSSVEILAVLGGKDELNLSKMKIKF